jgi:hypothetical protein
MLTIFTSQSKLPNNGCRQWPLQGFGVFLFCFFVFLIKNSLISSQKVGICSGLVYKSNSKVFSVPSKKTIHMMIYRHTSKHWKHFPVSHESDKFGTCSENSANSKIGTELYLTSNIQTSWTSRMGLKILNIFLYHPQMSCC